LASLAALAAGLSACSEEGEGTTAPSETPAASETHLAFSTQTSSPTPPAISSTLPACPTPGPGRTFQYQSVPSGETAAHTDDAAGYIVTYPAEWTICQVANDSGIPDFASAIELYDDGGLLRVSVYVYQNPMNLTLEEWIRDHNSIFFERTTETRTIAGVSALVAPLNFEGRPAPGAYLQHREFMVGIKGLTTEDFEVIASRFSLL
jgi:hypothetical protein